MKIPISYIFVLICFFFISEYFLYISKYEKKQNKIKCYYGLDGNCKCVHDSESCHMKQIINEMISMKQYEWSDSEQVKTNEKYPEENIKYIYNIKT